MAKLMYDLNGNRGRSMKVYDNKAVILTKPSVGSFLTSNTTDGEKTIFLIDVVGVQFKKTGLTIGYLQLETASGQMNNQSSNQFSENTFTFDSNLDTKMEEVYKYIVDRIEFFKYGSVTQDISEALPIL